MASLHGDEFTERPDLVKQRARVLFWQRIGMGLLALYMIASLAVLTINAIAGVAARAELLDCTRPEGKCYAEGQKRTGAVIDQLMKDNQMRAVVTRDVVRAAAFCNNVMPDNVSQAEFEVCIEERMRK